jgi:hypothetical protein
MKRWVETLLMLLALLVMLAGSASERHWGKVAPSAPPEYAAGGRGTV